jgi:hypothetical protein
MDNKKLELCRYIQNNISKLCQTEIDEIFKILHKNNSTYTQNNNGIFVNLNWIDVEILQQLHDYVSFCIKSQTEISKYEMMKNMLNNSMVNKEKHENDIVLACNYTSNIIQNTGSKIPKVSSSMKFYLLKKKFMKKNTIVSTNMNNVLNYEEYVI